MDSKHQFNLNQYFPRFRINHEKINLFKNVLKNLFKNI